MRDLLIARARQLQEDYAHLLSPSIYEAGFRDLDAMGDEELLRFFEGMVMRIAA